MSNLSFDPSKTATRAAFQPLGAEDRVTDAGWQQHLLGTEAFTLTHTPIATNSFNRGGQKTRSLHGMYAVAGSLGGDFEPEGLAVYMAQIQRRGATPTILDPGGAYRHILSPTQPDIDYQCRRLQQQIYRNDGAIQSTSGAACKSVKLDFAKSEVIKYTIEQESARLHYFGVPSQTTGTSTDPFVRGLPRREVREGTADFDLEIQVVAVPGTGGADFDVAFKLASEPAFGATTVPIFAGSWARVMLSTDGSGYGKRPSHVEVYWPDAAGIATGDTWSMAHANDVLWAANLPQIEALSTVEVEVFIDGVLAQERGGAKVDTLGLTISQGGVLPSDGLGDVWPAGILQRGEHMAEWTASRRWLSNYLTTGAEGFEPFHLDVRCYSPVRIGATDREYFARFVSPYCIASGTRPTATDKNDVSESWTFSAEPAPQADAEGFIDDVTVILDNAFPVLPGA